MAEVARPEAIIYKLKRGNMNRGGALRCTSLILGALLALGAVPMRGRAQSGAGAKSGAGAAATSAPAGARAGGGGAIATDAAPVDSQASASIIATVAALRWLEGTWRGEWGPRVAEQVWMAPQAGVMTGALSLMETDKVLVLELFSILQTSGGVGLNIRHFTPELNSWEKGDPTRLTLGSFDNKKFEFDNAVDGKPKKFIFVRTDADTYVSHAEIVPDAGEAQVIEITYHRVAPVPQAVDKSAGKKKKP
jgi:uncharacterized protein DUF6265